MSKYKIGDKVGWTDKTMKITSKGSTMTMRGREGKVIAVDGSIVTAIYRKKEHKIHEDNLRFVGEGHSALTELVKSMADSD